MSSEERGTFVAESEAGKSEGALWRKRDQVEKYLDMADRIVVVIESDEAVAFINRKGCQLLECSKEDVLGKNWFDTYLPEDDIVRARDVHASLMAGQTEGVEYVVAPVLTQEGKKKTIAWHNIILADESGIIVGTLSTGEDVAGGRETQEELKVEKERFEALSENAPFGLVMIDSDGRFTSVNSKFREIVGYQLQDVPDGRTWFRKAFPDPDYRHKVISMWIDDVVRSGPGEKRPRNLTVTCKDGTEKVATIISVKLDTGEHLMAVEDITERTKMEEALRESENKFKSLVEESIAGVYIIQDGIFRYVNRRFAEIHGYTVGEMVDKLTPTDVTLPEDLPLVLENTRRRIAGEVETIHYTFRIRRKKDGAVSHIEAYGSRMMYQGRPAVIGTLLDITDRVQAEETIRQMAYHDSLTGLPNRALVSDRLSVALTHAKRSSGKAAVMMLDLDRFKEVNDTMGHEAGDVLLKHVARGIEGVLRKSDTVARMGGDEFMVLLPEIVRVEDSIVVAEKILETFRGPFISDRGALRVTTSIGIALYPDDGEDVDTLMRRADIAMYRAKAQGRDQAIYYSHDYPLS